MPGLLPTWPAGVGLASGALTGAVLKQGARYMVIPTAMGVLTLLGLQRYGYVDIHVGRMRHDLNDLYKRMDLNNDGKVDMEDMTALAKRAGVTNDVAAGSAGFVAGFCFGFRYF